MSEQRKALSSAEIAELFERIDWEDVTRRLLAYTARRLASYGDLRQAGRTPDDYVQEAVALALEGRRNIPVEAAHSPVGFFAVVIDSLISHDAEKRRRQPSVPVDEIDVADPSSDFEAAFAAREEAEQFVASLDAELQVYARLRLMGVMQRAEEYAAALNTTVAHIRNLEKRLQRQRLKSPGLLKP